MPKQTKIKKVLVIGSGPIIVGQAAEFDYAGTQACLALKEEGCEVILINNNPATIMTDETMADVVYFEPLTVESILKIIIKEKPDGLLATVGGQTGLNLALKLHQEGILNKYNIQMLGTPIESIIKGEDREQFRSLMHELEEPVPESEIVDSLQAAFQFADQVGFPIIVRPAYTLGGSGGGIASDKEELEQFVKRGLKASPIHQCLIEKSIAGFKEIEYEVVRDADDTCITICGLENIDPVGIHTGDAIVVAPSQTLSEEEINILRTSAIHIVRSLGIIGGCNVQFALHPTSKEYFVIEVNPRVSRSSALASKVTGYPIARVAAKLALGYTLQDLGEQACEEPVLDYIAVKFPRWPFDKFTDAVRKLGTQMKATGEVMAIDNNLEGALQKAVRSLELQVNGLALSECEQYSTNELLHLASEADDRRFFVLLELLRRGTTVEQLHDVTKVTPYFLTIMERLITLEKGAQATSFEQVTADQLLTLKQSGFSDEWLASVWGLTLEALREKREQYHIRPSFEAVAARSGDESTELAYYYSSWSQHAKQNEHNEFKKILIIGSGPIRIGQGIEFDYCSVHGVLALQKYGYETILINNNPETVSTDYKIADRLYFEPLSVEDVLNVIEHEQVDGVIVQFGGQTAISLVEGLEKAGVPLLGSSLDTIDQLEDRERFYKLLKTLGLPHIPGLTVDTQKDLIDKVNEIGYPVLLRPSYVIGGSGMIVLQSEKELQAYLSNETTSVQYPILVDAYYPGIEVEVDVVTDGTNVVIPAIFEHVEKAGVHSGDSLAVTPPFSISAKIKQKVVDYSKKLANGIGFKGVFNIQFVMYEDVLYVLEVNPRASRTVPITSKVTGLNMIELATATLLNKSLPVLTTKLGLLPENEFYTVKAPVFSTVKLPGVDPKLVPEMKSTGELMAIGRDLSNSFKQAFFWNEQLTTSLVKEQEVYIEASLDEELMEKLRAFNLRIVTEQDFGKDDEANVDFEKWVKSDKAFAMISTTASCKFKRELAAQYGLFVFSAEETVQAFTMIELNDEVDVNSIQQWQKTGRKEVLVQ